MSDVDNNVIALMVLQEENKQLKEKLAQIEQIVNEWYDLSFVKTAELIKEALEKEQRYGKIRGNKSKPRLS